MSKVSELSMLVDELKKCGETLVRISEELADLFSSGKDAMQPVKRLLLRRKPTRSQKLKCRKKKHSRWKMSSRVCG